MTLLVGTDAVEMKELLLLQVCLLLDPVSKSGESSQKSVHDCQQQDGSPCCIFESPERVLGKPRLHSVSLSRKFQ